MIANCGQLGLDWRQASLSDYLEALEAHNEAHQPDGQKPEVSNDLRSFMAAHGASVAAGSDTAGGE